ncbi:MgtC/SapB family protein [Azorhizophilus paspali]|uniref:MgtC/SapB family protein n=1 Tax=Azorhizophilus paspali TaxID=69963 RepID=A0ABV6SGS5_AZOPA
MRTFGLSGLLGRLSALLGQQLGLAARTALLLVFGLLVLAGYLGDLRNTGDQGMTSEIATLLNFLLGSLALTADHQTLAAAGAVVVALLLSLKEVARRAMPTDSVGALQHAEATVHFRGIAAGSAKPGLWSLGPHETWWMVVLIAAIGFAAYMVIRLVGTRHGLLLTTLLGGIVSSTAMNPVSPAANATNAPSARLCSPGHLDADVCAGVAGGRTDQPRLAGHSALPMGVATLVYAGGALLHYRGSGQESAAESEPLPQTPFELDSALRFAALLVLILFLVEAGRHWLGDTGVYLVALLAGMTDADAITLPLARNALGELGSKVAMRGIFLAAMSNSLVKGGLIAVIGGSRLALLSLPVMASSLLAGLATLWLR